VREQQQQVTHLELMLVWLLVVALLHCPTHLVHSLTLLLLLLPLLLLPLF
jgi:hypothetical protein